MRFASLLSGGFITAVVVNPQERKLAKRTSVQRCIHGTHIICLFILTGPFLTDILKISSLQAILATYQIRISDRPGVTMHPAQPDK